VTSGVTRRAVKSRIYVVTADQSVVATELRAGSARATHSVYTRETVVVPLDARKMPSLLKWPAVMQVPYNIAIATAAVHWL
jgi:hypothetical protein